jgi:hypothetical protein
VRRKRTAGALRALPVEQLQQLVGGQLDFLVSPLGGSVVAGDQAGPVDSAEVAVDERVPGLCLVGGALGQPEVPLGYAMLEPKLSAIKLTAIRVAKLKNQPVGG